MELVHSRGGLDKGGAEPAMNWVSLPRVINRVKCPVPRCTTVAHSAGHLRDHFMYRHFHSRVAMVQEGKEPLPRCIVCGTHIPSGRLINYQRIIQCDRNM